MRRPTPGSSEAARPAPPPRGESEGARSDGERPAAGPWPAAGVRQETGSLHGNDDGETGELAPPRRLEQNVTRGELPRLDAVGMRADPPTARLADVLEASADGILLVDGQGEVVYANRRFAELWGIPEDRLVAEGPGNALCMVSERVVDPGEFRARVDHLLRHPEASCRDEVLLKDGRVFDCYAVPARDAGGGRPERVWSFHDITRRIRAEAELRGSHEFLDAIINSIADPVFVKDQAHRFALVNAAFCALLGRGRESIEGATDADFFPAEQVAVFLRQDALVFETGVPDVHEESITWADGKTHTIVTKKTLYTDRAARKFIVGVLRDITRDKLAEEALGTSERNFRAIFDGAASGMLLLDLEAGRFVGCNPAFSKMLGFTAEELRSMGVGDLHTPEDLPLVLEQLGAFVRGEQGVRSEMRFRRKDGATFFADLHPTLIALGGRKTVLATINDVSARRQAAEQALRLMAAVEHAADDIIVLGLDGLITYTNPAFERTTGFSAGEAAGRDINDLLCRDLEGARVPEIWERIRAGGNWNGRFLNRTKDGRLIHLDGAVSAILDSSGAIVGYLSVRRDVTALLEMEAHAVQADKMEAIGTLAGGSRTTSTTS